MRFLYREYTLFAVALAKTARDASVASLSCVVASVTFRAHLSGSDLLLSLLHVDACLPVGFAALAWISTRAVQTYLATVETENLLSWSALVRWYIYAWDSALRTF